VTLKRLYWTARLAWCVRGQAGYAFRPIEAIRRDQARRVRRIVAHAWRTVPYYRETMARLGLTPADFRTVEDLAKLPILERRELHADPERFLSSACRPERSARTLTSGSSGTPIAVTYDMASLVMTMAHGERPRPVIARAVGRWRGYRETLIASPYGNLVQMSRFCRERTWVPWGFRARSQLLSVADPIEENLARMDAHKPDLVMSFGSYFEALAPFWLALGSRHHVPRAIGYGGDALSDTVRRRLAEERGIEVVSGYQAVEANRIGFECECHNGVHLNVDLHPVRIVDADGRDLPPGEQGDVVVSTLVNRATVLLNYRLGDLAAFVPGPCPCGRSLPRLTQPLGRCDDWLATPSGQRVSSYGVAGVFLQGDPIWQYQVVQESPRRVRVGLHAGEPCDRSSLACRVGDGLRNVLGGEVEVQVEFVTSFERTPFGKHRCILSRLAGSQRAPAGEARP